MVRYLAIFSAGGDDEHPAGGFGARASRSELTLRVAHRGLSLHARRSDPLLELPNRRGAILGHLFDRRTGGRVERVTEALAHEIALTRGQALLQRYWGPYLLLLSDEAGGVVLRDPSGAIGAYHLDAGAGLHACFSDLPAADALIAQVPAPDESFIRQWLVFPYLRTARTGLAAITEMLAGTRLRLTRGGLEAQAGWNPWAFTAEDRQFGDFEEAKDALRREILATVSRQAYCSGPVLLELSGGLDSSILAAALARGGVGFQAATFVTRSPDGDERHYAAAVAKAVGAPLAEIPEEPPDGHFFDVPPKRLRPGPSPVLEPMHRAFARHARAMGARTCLTGAGGDNVFCYLTTAAPAVDAARALGPHAGFETLKNVADICGCTLWTAASYAARKFLKSHRSLEWKRETDFLDPAAAGIVSDGHPWLDAPPGTAVGKREHVKALVHIQHFLDLANADGAIDLRHPLLAQPVMELCLRIPTWMWTRDGRNRAVARAAFADLLPPDIVSRRNKGRLESLFVRAFRAARPGLRTLLCDGELAGRRLVDRQAIEAYLSLGGDPSDTRYFRILDLAAMELWLRSWRD